MSTLRLKEYVYVSNARVDSLFDQLPEARRREIAHRLGLDLKLLQYEANIGARSMATPLGRLQLVCEHLEDQQQVGTVEHPLEFFAGNLLMRQGASHIGFESQDDVVFFIGSNEDDKYVVLGGSDCHLTRPLTSSQSWNSGISGLMRALEQSSLEREWPAERERELLLPSSWASEAVQIYQENPHLEHRLEFMAVRWAETAPTSLRRAVLGSPLYVALAPVPSQEGIAVPVQPPLWRRWLGLPD